MAGLTVKQNATYLRGKNGAIYLASDKELTNPYKELVGKVVGLDYRDEEFNGAVNEKLYVSIQDDEGNVYKLGVNTSTSAYKMLVSFLKSADLSKDVAITPKGEETKSGTISTEYLVGQGGGWLKSFWVKDVNPLPKWKEVKVSGKTLWDKEEYLNVLKEAVNDMKASLKPQGAPVKDVFDAPKGTDNEEEGDNLPF